MAQRADALPRAGRSKPAETGRDVALASGEVLATQELTKRYGDFVAVDGLNLRLAQGEIFGLLGPNGAGKTTTILMLMGLTEPTSGSVNILGYDPVHRPLQVKRLVGYLPEHVALYDDLTARDNLLYTADLNGLNGVEGRSRVASALERVGMASVADKRVGAMSHGMRQRLGIADVLIKRPRLVILDEPTLGLDPEAVNQLLDLILGMAREEGLTVLLSSHQLQQVQRICSEVGIFVKGRLIAQGTIGALAEKLAGGVRTAEVGATPGGPELGKVLESLPGVTAVQPPAEAGGYWQVRSAGDIRPAVARVIIERGWSLLHLRERDYGLEEIYLRYFQGGES